MKASVQRVADALAALGVEPEITEFAESTRTAEEAALAVGATVGQIVKSLVFSAEGGPLLVLASGAHRVDMAKLARAAGGPVARANADLVRGATGLLHRRGATGRPRATRCARSSTAPSSSMTSCGRRRAHQMRSFPSRRRGCWRSRGARWRTWVRRGEGESDSPQRREGRKGSRRARAECSNLAGSACSGCAVVIEDEPRLSGCEPLPVPQIQAARSRVILNVGRRFRPRGGRGRLGAVAVAGWRPRKNAACGRIWRARESLAHAVGRRRA